MAFHGRRRASPTATTSSSRRQSWTSGARQHAHRFREDDQGRAGCGLGIDAVVLGATQAARRRLHRVGMDSRSSASRSRLSIPSPSGLATEWPSGRPALVIGADQSSMSRPTTISSSRPPPAMIPFSSGWLLRGDLRIRGRLLARASSPLPGSSSSGIAITTGTRPWSAWTDYVRAGGSPLSSRPAGSTWIPIGTWVRPRLRSCRSASCAGVAPWIRAAPVLVAGSSRLRGDRWPTAAQVGERRAPRFVASGQGAEALVSVGGRVVVARQGRRSRSCFLERHEPDRARRRRGLGRRRPVHGGRSRGFCTAGDQASPQSDAAFTWVTDDQAQLPLRLRRGRPGSCSRNRLLLAGPP